MQATYIIHACPQRMWYVTQYLVPSMEEQGITDIHISCDVNQMGNLESCMGIFRNMGDNDGAAWHLQDDVIICRDFKERTEKFKDGIVCGYCWDKEDFIDRVDWVKPPHMWWSFPCIRIPNRIAWECAEWFYNTAKNMPKYELWVISKKFDDAFFKDFMKLKYPDYNVLNLRPSLVDHIDYLVGGSIINTARVNYVTKTRAEWFEDQDLVNDLEKHLKYASRHYDWVHSDVWREYKL